MAGLDKLIVVEELDPYLEWHAKAIAKDANPDIEIHGKLSGDFPMEFEYTADVVEKGIASSLGISPKVDFDSLLSKSEEVKKILPPRPPVLCPGCPHTASFFAIKRATGGDAVYPSDIGCYTLGVNPPLSTVDITLCMGGGAGTANGLSYVLDQDIIVTVGDSTFFHACIPALIDAVYNNNKFVLVVLDNRTTAMTGHQPHPGTGEKACGQIGKFIPIEDVVKGLGVDFVEVVNPYNLDKMTEVIERAKAHDRVAVVVARRACAILWNRERKAKGIKIKPFVVTENCNRCLTCVTDFTCPALVLVGDQIQIDESLCAGCGVCFQVCPSGAIVSKATMEGR
jgi:indolepyruvate ferredoxin oxidoreductase alpha subunit